MARSGSGTIPEGLHEWVSFDDPDEDRTWVFDITFLTSAWTCIYSRGCQGILTAASPTLQHGCCSYGAHLVDRADARRVERLAAKLTAEQWQLRSRAHKGGPLKQNGRGELVTRIVDGACIFLNRPGFGAGAGCALHQLAVTSGRSPMDTKPEVCWQLPLRREDAVADDGSVTSTIRQWDRRDWGPGGQEFHWWCTEAPDAFVGEQPVYRAMAEELTAMVGHKVYRRLKGYLEGATKPTPLPHPALRRRAR